MFIKRLYKILKFIFTIFSISYLIAAGVLVKQGLKKQVDRCEVAVVLGTQVMADGKPSLRLQARLNKAIELYQAKMFSKIIVTGGTGKNGQNEAKSMQEYLISQGVEKDDILMEDKAHNTFQNAQLVSNILKKNGFEKVMIISQYFHITRAQLAFEAFGFPSVYHTYPDFFELRDIYSILREVPAYGYYWLQFSILDVI